jgi:predicted nucleic acid-binding protein
MILADTSFLIDYARDPSLAGYLVDGDPVCVTVISYFEILVILKRLRSKREEHFFRQLFAEIPVLDYTRVAADHAASIGGQLARTGNTVNTLDLMIARIAKEHHADTIITVDEDFKVIGPLAGLEVRWYRAPREGKSTSI